MSLSNKIGTLSISIAPIRAVVGRVFVLWPQDRFAGAHTAGRE